MLKRITLSTMIAAMSLVSFNSFAYDRNYYGGGATRTYNNNITGAWPGSGPYDSAIAQSGIMAGASILNNLINRSMAPPAPAYGGPPVIINQAPPTNIYVIPGGATKGASLAPGCRQMQTGYDMSGRPLFSTVCNNIDNPGYRNR